MPGSLGFVPGSLGFVPGSLGFVPGSLGFVPGSLGFVPGSLGFVPGSLGFVPGSLGFVPGSLGFVPGSLGFVVSMSFLSGANNVLDASYLTFLPILTGSPSPLRLSSVISTVLPAARKTLPALLVSEESPSTVTV